MSWDTEPATEKQLNYLRMFGCEPDQLLTKQAANDLLTTLEDDPERREIRRVNRLRESDMHVNKQREKHMNIWATIDFGKIKVTQEWNYLSDEIGEDSQPHDYIQVLIVGGRKQLVIELEKQSIVKSDSGTFYLGGLDVTDAIILP